MSGVLINLSTVSIKSIMLDLFKKKNKIKRFFVCRDDCKQRIIQITFVLNGIIYKSSANN